MLKTNISKENTKQIIEATGSIPELMNDVAVLLSGIYSQFNAVSPAAAKLFKTGVQSIVKDNDSAVWRTNGNQTGIAFRMPGQEE